ncbi:hypothetical protein FOA43_002454 [Brettanomyces nanus]|uniref:Trafficking protein particle complex II-specific subunit 130 n=1 Tax=Eeniella nana TaxID=13502 RepID=A0A875S2H0_EENNA|nr:uncharacterized protein FOA43_002454 [Brettanomyces nanus]QPG75113.1 hypothetical protein FOA43_002454 [Brettanomyces nanus]
MTVSIDAAYYDPFLVFKNTLEDQFVKRIRINTLRWKFQPTDPVRTIDNVELNYVQDTKAENTFVHFIFVTCSSVDEYRSKVRPVIRQWLNNVKSIQPMSMYYIILYQNVSLISTTDKFLKTSLLTKIRTDFADDQLTIENAFKIKSTYSDSGVETEVWNSILNAVRLGLMDSISSKLRYFQSLDPPLLGLRKSADLFKQIGQYDDSLRCYHNLMRRLGIIDEGRDGFESYDYSSCLLSNRESPQLVSSPSKFQLKCYIFKEIQFILTEDSIKSSGIYMRNMASLTSSLLELVNSVYDCYKKSEFGIVMAQDFFANRRLQLLLEKKEDDVPDQLYELLGDLKLLERDQFINLGASKGYRMPGSMAEVGLSEKDDDYTVRDIELRALLSDDKTFKDHVLKITEEVIKLYSESQYKANTVDTVSTEMALMIYYGFHDYEASLEVLNNSFRYFKNSGWNIIAFNLLKVYIENLEKLKDKDDVVSYLLNSYLEMVSMGNKCELNRFTTLLNELVDPLSIENDELFDIKVDPHVCCGDKTDQYVINVKLASKLVDIEVDNAILYLENEDGDPVEFVIGTFILKNGQNQLKLSSKQLFCVDLKAVRLKVQIGQLELLANVSESIRLYQIQSYVNSDNQIVNNTLIDVRVPSLRRLNKDELLLSANVGDKGFNGCEFVFRKTDSDRLVPDAKYRLTNENGELVDFKILEDDDRIIFKVEQIVESHAKLWAFVPYFFPPDVSDIKLFIDFSFKFGDGYSRRIQKKLDTTLEIAVSVQDIFRSSKLFSNYTINSVMVENPVRIQQVNLSPLNEEGHTIVQTWLSPKNIVAYIDQGSTFFYRLEELKDESLDLIIDYDDLHSEIVESLNQCYYSYLASLKSPLLMYFHLVSTMIFEKLTFKLNLYGLNGEMELIDYDISNFMETLKQVNFRDLPALIESITSLLSQFTEETKELCDSVLNGARRTLVINVTLPVVNVVDTVEFKFEKQLQYLVCEPINMMLSFDVFVVQFADKSKKKVRFKTESDKPKQISLKLGFTDYEQNWLIAGCKDFTAQFNLDGRQAGHKARRILECKLTLIPLRVGKLELPKVEIQNLTDYKVEMELDYKNSSESLLVVSELNKVVQSF